MSLVPITPLLAENIDFPQFLMIANSYLCHTDFAPLDLAMQLSDTLNVPLEVWLGIENYAPAEVSTDAYEVARAYDRADIKSKNMVRMALDLELVKEETV